jgi:hypothetical protein
MGSFKEKLRRAGTIIAPIEAYTPNQNRAELAIRKLKRMYRRTMLESKAPEVLWDHCFELMAEIRSHTALNLMSLYGQTPTTHLLGDTADISHLCQFGWYDYVWWLDVTDALQNKKLGHYLDRHHDNYSNNKNYTHLQPPHNNHFILVYLSISNVERQMGGGN